MTPQDSENLDQTVGGGQRAKLGGRNPLRVGGVVAGAETATGDRAG
jgi:hypothetical protein